MYLMYTVETQDCITWITLIQSDRITDYSPSYLGQSIMPYIISNYHIGREWAISHILNKFKTQSLKVNGFKVRKNRMTLLNKSYHMKLVHISILLRLSVFTLNPEMTEILDNWERITYFIKLEVLTSQLKIYEVPSNTHKIKRGGSN